MGEARVWIHRGEVGGSYWQLLLTLYFCGKSYYPAFSPVPSSSLSQFLPLQGEKKQRQSLLTITINAQ